MVFVNNLVGSVTQSVDDEESKSIDMDPGDDEEEDAVGTNIDTESVSDELDSRSVYEDVKTFFSLSDLHFTVSRQYFKRIIKAFTVETAGGDSSTEPHFKLFALCFPKVLNNFTAYYQLKVSIHVFESLSGLNCRHYLFSRQVVTNKT